MLRYPARPQSGFTLVEVLIAAVIAAMLATAMAHVFSSVLDVARTARTRERATADAQLAITLLHQDVSQADTLYAPTPASLTLISAAGDTVRYAWSTTAGDPLTRQVNGGGADTAAVGVDSLRFEVRSVSRQVTHEVVGLGTQEAPIAQFNEGDWDAWVAATACEYNSPGFYDLKSDKCIGDEFWPADDYDRFTRAFLRVAAIDKFPATVDIIVEVYEAHEFDDRPGELVADGRIDCAVLTLTHEWHEASLTMVAEVPVAAGAHYWLVFRPEENDKLGGVEYDLLQNCEPGEIPDNGFRFRMGDGFAAKWKAFDPFAQNAFRIYGGRETNGLHEVVRTVTTPCGLDFALAVSAGDETELHSGYVALPAQQP